MIVDNILISENLFRLAWDTDRNPHAIIVGATGMGKTRFTKFLIAKILKSDPESKFYFGDFKNMADYQFALKYKTTVTEALSLTNAELQDRIAGNRPISNNVFLILDEFPSFLMDLDSPSSVKTYQKMVSKILMVGRSYRIHIIMIVQRASADLFLRGARDNFGFRFSVGKLSPESVRTIFSDYVEELKGIELMRGQGFLYRESYGFDLVEIPLFDESKLEDWLINNI